MIEKLLPHGVVAVETFEDVPGQPSFPEEESLVANAVETRRREFITARHCAREALAKLGYAPVPIAQAGNANRCGRREWSAASLTPRDSGLPPSLAECDREHRYRYRAERQAA